MVNDQLVGLFCILQRYLHETMKMKAGRILLLLLCLSVVTFGVVKKSSSTYNIFLYIYVYIFCLNIISTRNFFLLSSLLFTQIAGPQTCPASDLESGCSDSEEWRGEFFPGIPKIKYEVERLMKHFSYLYRPFLFRIISSYTHEIHISYPFFQLT